MTSIPSLFNHHTTHFFAPRPLRTEATDPHRHGVSFFSNNLRTREKSRLGFYLRLGTVAQVEGKVADEDTKYSLCTRIT